ncbi:alkaline phosphatase-like protein [Dothidotthia symphoricarpi CBS 119687]|uniref:alkaline phosphatase n=1 Tax=Dothidotthia symphoricarpi CBS 119687 TaxID=1392245 RepID=A0A6A6AJA8_9PLEO|nr:alkaline phosphatase-like protein [Dothidotthia symphoricarpi CBS 119687]KAF2131890.1 alkaline phosphatase-like protein [Dothidotthia symphoricarpi CBS 119687]
MRSIGVAAALLVGAASAQSFRRLGACPTLGCVFPPDQADFLAGQYFDIRLEVHAPKNGSEVIGLPLDERFTFTIAKGDEAAKSATEYFELDEPKLEKWNFTWFEDFFARDAKRPTWVDVSSKAYRRVALYEPGEYTATLHYNNGSSTKATWLVRDLAEERKAKNIIFFIGDGMTTNMITAARLIGHKSINGKYQSTMAMDKFPVLGHQMTHSIDSFITDSANSAAALNTGHKSTVNCLNVYADSSKDPFDDPKVETIAEMFYRLVGGHIGIVSTAFIADATPAALVSHTRLRSEYEAIVDTYLNGYQNYTWTNIPGVDVLFGGGAEQFYPPALGGKTYQGKDYFKEFADAGYQVHQNRTSLLASNSTEKALGIFSTSNMAKWLDRNVYRSNLNQSLSPTGDKTPALDQPGLKEMTLKAIDILQARSGDEGYFLMSEAASIDKMMHVLDYDRALGELLELDDTIKATIAKLKETDTLKETLILVTADHGHGFDVMGSVDTHYLAAQNVDRKKRDAIGVYENSGLSQYANTGNLTYTDSNFPSNWDPRYTLFQGLMADPDRRENWSVHKDGPRKPAVALNANVTDYTANPKDGQNGILLNGTLPISDDQGVHSLTDVPVFAMGPCQEMFGGVYNSVDIFFGMAECFGLSRGKP